MPVEAKDGLRFILTPSSTLSDPFNSQTEWPRLSCPQANQLSLEFGDLRVDDKVGIGTTTDPTEKLEVVGKVKATNLDVTGVISTNQLSVTGSITTPLKLDDNLSINGNVGIGTTTDPTEKLEVVGKVKATNLDVTGAISTNQLSVTGSITTPLKLDDSLSISGKVGISITSSSNFQLNIGGTGGQNALHVASDFGFRGDDRLNLIRFGSDGDYQVLHKASGAFGRNTLAMHVHADDAFGVYSTGGNSLLEVKGGTGDVYVKGNVGIGTTNPSTNLDVKGDLKISGDFQFPNSDGGLATLTPNKYNNESSFKKNNVKLSLGNSGLFIVGQPPLEYEFAVGHTFSRFIFNGGVLQLSTNFLKKFSVNQDGDAYFAGSKGGYVVDYFVNRVGDTLEQGDVVIISEHQVSHYSGSQNNIPIPEVDLTDVAYNSRVCGIVAKVTTEKDLPYVEVESPTQPEILPEEIEKLEVSDIPVLHPLKVLAAESKEDLDITKIPDRQMGTMVTLGAFAHCKVDADIAPIQVGDLLTTSSTRGHAQKVLELERTTGAIIGKALKSLEKGKGKIPVLVMLQ